MQACARELTDERDNKDRGEDIGRRSSDGLEVGVRHYDRGDRSHDVCERAGPPVWPAEEELQPLGHPGQEQHHQHREASPPHLRTKHTAEEKEEGEKATE